MIYSHPSIILQEILSRLLVPGYYFPTTPCLPYGFCTCQLLSLIEPIMVLKKMKQETRHDHAYQNSNKKVTQAFLHNSFCWCCGTTSSVWLFCWAIFAVLPFVPRTTSPFELCYCLIRNCVPRSETRSVSAKTESILNIP